MPIEREFSRDRARLARTPQNAPPASRWGRGRPRSRSETTSAAVRMPVAPAVPAALFDNAAGNADSERNEHQGKHETTHGDPFVSRESPLLQRFCQVACAHSSRAGSYA